MIKTTSHSYRIPSYIYITVFAFILLLPLAFAEAQIVPCGPHLPPPNNSCTISHLFDLLINIYNFLLGMSALVAMIFIIWGGVQMFSPTQDMVESGKKTVTYAISGLIIILVSYLGVNTIIVILTGGDRNITEILNPLNSFRSNTAPESTDNNVPPTTRSDDLPLDLSSNNTPADNAALALDTFNENYVASENNVLVTGQVIASYGYSSTDPQYVSEFDLTDSGRIDEEDVIIFVQAYTGGENIASLDNPAAGVVLGTTTANSLWWNEANPLDVNNDGAVTPIDTLLLNNFLNAHGNTRLPGPPPPYLDVTGDNKISREDADAVTLFLNTEQSSIEPNPSARWQNQNNPLDVNNDGQVSSLDSLLIINHVNTHGITRIPDGPPPYLDVNNDGAVTPLDYLMLINHFNSQNNLSSGTPAETTALNHLDANDDGSVTLEEAQPVFEDLMNSVGAKREDPEYRENFDLNDDGLINSADIEIYIDTFINNSNLREREEQPATAPEQIPPELTEDPSERSETPYILKQRTPSLVSNNRITMGERHDTVENARLPKVKFFGNNQAIAVWLEQEGRVGTYGGHHTAIKASILTNDGQWENPVQLNPASRDGQDTFFADSHEIAIDTENNIFVFWKQEYQDARVGHVYGRKYAQGRWDDPFILFSSERQGQVSTPLVSFGNSGHGVAVWTVRKPVSATANIYGQRDGEPANGAYRMVASNFRNGRFEEPYMMLDAHNYLKVHHLEAADDGTITVIWEQVEDALYSRDNAGLIGVTEGKKYLRTSKWRNFAWQDPVTIFEGAIKDLRTVKANIHPQGSGIVVWTHWENDEEEEEEELIIASSYLTPNQSWSAPQQLDVSNVRGIYKLDTQFLTSTRALLMWGERCRLDPRSPAQSRPVCIHSAEMSSTGEWSNRQTISESGQALTFIELIANEPNSLLAFTGESLRDNINVWRYKNNGTWQQYLRTEDITRYEGAYEPFDLEYSLSADRQGNVLAVWSQNYNKGLHGRGPVIRSLLFEHNHLSGQKGAPMCGNGIVDEGEECDDGNNANRDGCDSSCRLESDEAGISCTYSLEGRNLTINGQVNNYDPGRHHAGFSFLPNTTVYVFNIRPDGTFTGSYSTSSIPGEVILSARNHGVLKRTRCTEAE